LVGRGQDFTQKKGLTAQKKAGKGKKPPINRARREEGRGELRRSKKGSIRNDKGSGFKSAFEKERKKKRLQNNRKQVPHKKGSRSSLRKKTKKRREEEQQTLKPKSMRKLWKVYAKGNDR